MEEIVFLVVQIVMDLLLNLLFCFPEILCMFWGEKDENNHTVLKCLVAFASGVIAGWLSLVFFPKLFLPYVWLRVVNLILAPVLIGMAGFVLAESVQRKKMDVWPQRHFWYAFFISLGYILARLLLAK